MPGIYVHIPFCKRKCSYCDFASYAGKLQYLGAYLDMLLHEAAIRGKDREWGTFDTVFIGGGTPSLLSGDQVHVLLTSLFAAFDIAAGAEITMECNPGTLDAWKLSAYRQAGVNRLSLGVQSMDNGLLKKLGRIHTARDVGLAFRLAQEAGFTNINVDVMNGLPGQTELDYLSTLQDVAGFAPAHISTYSLILEEDTPLHEAVHTNAQALPPEEERDIMQDVGISFLRTHGYRRYEISNLAKPGFECRHNINYWSNGPYLGLGLAAHSAWRLDGQWTRWENSADLSGYIAGPAKPLQNIKLTQILYEEEAFESVMLGLRMVDGLDLAAFAARFGRGFMEMYPEAVKRLLEKEWLILEDGCARLNERGLDMQNAALQFFM